MMYCGEKILQTKYRIQTEKKNFEAVLTQVVFFYLHESLLCHCDRY